MYLAAVTGGYSGQVSGEGGIYTSSSGGSTWTLTSAPIGQWKAITSDSTGTILAATQAYVGIYVSVTG